MKQIKQSKQLGVHFNFTWDRATDFHTSEIKYKDGLPKVEQLETMLMMAFVAANNKKWYEFFRTVNFLMDDCLDDISINKTHTPEEYTLAILMHCEFLMYEPKD